MLDSPLFAVIGISLMACTTYGILAWLPLLKVETRAHKNSLPLDGLRGLLASCVVFHHARIWFDYQRTGVWSMPQSPLYRQLGPAVVTMFFFVSGYLFWSKVLRRPEQITWSRLIPNRIRRIMPAYWVAVALIIVSALCVSKFHLHELPVSLAAEIVSWIFSGFPGLNSPSINCIDQLILSAGVFWTIRMEWMFYALLPILRWFRSGARFAVIFAIAYAMMKLLSTAALAHPESKFISELLLLQTFVRMFVLGFSIGMLAAYQFWGERVQNWLRSPWAAAVAAVLVCIELASAGDPYKIKQSLLLAPMFFLVVAGNPFGGLLSCAPMRALGQISYSIYILHGVLLFDVLFMWRLHHGVTSSPVAYAFLIWIISIGIALVSSVSYWYIERPFTQVRAPHDVPDK